MSKAQGFPVATIALIVIILLTIAALSFFFFQSYWKGQESTEGMQCQQKCEEIQSVVSSNRISEYNMLIDLDEKETYCNNCGNKTCKFMLANGTTCNLNCSTTLTQNVCG